MANLRGKGALQNASLILQIQGKNEKGAYVVAQIDQSLKNPAKVAEGNSLADSNPFLNSREVEHPEGGTYVDHGKFYQQSQIDKMLEVAKETVDKDGKPVYGIEANLGINNGEVFINTSKDMGPTKNPRFGKNTMEAQENVRAAAKEFSAKQREDRTKDLTADAEAKVPEMETPEISTDTPEV